MTRSFLSRRTFLKGSAGLGILAAGLYLLPGTSLFRRAQNNAHALFGDMNARFLRQIITKNPATTRRIMWQSETPLANAAVEYRTTDSETSQQVAACDVTFSDDGQTNCQYSALLEDLQPDTNYEYRVTGSKSASDYSDWSALAHTAWQRHPEAQFFINMGDIVDNGEDHTQWQAWFDSVGPMIAKIPFAPIMGNHETYDQNWKVRLPEAHLHYFDVPENQSATFSRYYYSFDHGAVHFIVLNSQWDETNDFKPGLLDEQLAWLKDDTQRSTAKWKVVLIHKDVLQYRIKKRPERKEGISAVGRAFMPLFDELGIDLVLTAHLHTYRNRGRLYDKQPSTDKAPLYILTGVAGNVRYPNLWTDHAFDKVVAPQPETDNYLTLTVTDSSLTITCYLPDGQEIDRAHIAKI